MFSGRFQTGVLPGGTFGGPQKRCLQCKTAYDWVKKKFLRTDAALRRGAETSTSTTPAKSLRGVEGWDTFGKTNRYLDKFVPSATAKIRQHRRVERQREIILHKAGLQKAEL